MRKEVLNSVLNDILNNRQLIENDLLECLLASKLKDRADVNFFLAKAFYDVGNFAQSSIHAKRAWIYSDFEVSFAEFYIEVLKKLAAISEIVKVYKQTAMRAAKNLEFEKSINLFNQAFYFKAIYEKKDIFEYDFDILSKIEDVAERFMPLQPKADSQSAKFKIAYLTYGLADAGSVFAKIIPLYAKYHDKDMFDIVFFVPERKEQIYSSAHSFDVIRAIEDFGCRVVCARDESDRFKRWLFTIDDIVSFSPDAFITFAALARFEYYFIASALPKDIKKIALIYGPPAQFAPPLFDVAIGSSKHPLIDTPLNIFRALPDFQDESIMQNSIKNNKLNSQVPDANEDKICLVSIGRYTKFQNNIFWECIVDILRAKVNAYFVCVGATMEEVPAVDNYEKDIIDRIKFLGWRTDIDEILKMSDIYVNTFPNGGGYTIREAVKFGIPIVSFRHNYFLEFNQDRWNPIDEILTQKDMLVEYGNKNALVQLVCKLIDDKDFRLEYGKICYQEFMENIIKPETAMKSYEETLMGVLQS